jgi:hypothetical protein
MHDRDVEKAKKVMAYIEAVNRMDFPPQVVDKKTEKLVRAALELPSDAHTTLGVMEHLEVGLYTARRIVSIMNGLNPAASTPRQYQVTREGPRVLEDAPEPPVLRKRGRTQEGAPLAEAEGVQARQEVRTTFRMKRKKETVPARTVDRSHAVTVSYQEGATQFHGRKCLFHGESAVSVCPSCGTLFCMECVTHLDSCPRCELVIDFVDGASIGQAVDDRDLIETEAQRKAIQQRWAMKRLAEADLSAKVKEREMRAVRPDKEVMVEKLMRETQRRYNAPLVQDAPRPAYRAAARQVEEEQPSLQDEIAFLQQDAPEPQIYQPATVVEEDGGDVGAIPEPEEILPEERSSTGKADDKREKLRELLEQEGEGSGEARDMTRL